MTTTRHPEMLSDAPLGPSIHVAIPRIIGDLPAIGKDSQMTEGPRYSYRGIDDIMPHLKQLFARHGVHVTPVFDVLVDELGQTRSGNPQRRVVVKGMFRFTANDGSFTAAQTIGEALDTGDKAFNKAMTAAFKYAVIQTFAIAGADDPDNHQAELGGEQTPQARPTAERYPNFDALKALGPTLASAGVADDLKAWAAAQNISLNPGHDEPGLARVLEHAQGLLVTAAQDADADATEALATNAPAEVADAAVGRAVETEAAVVEMQDQLDAAIAKRALADPVEDVDTTDPLAKIMDEFGPGTTVVES